MPLFTSPRPLGNRKILYLGHTGAGKTGSLCSLAAAGYTVRILDLDNGTELIDDYVRNTTTSIYRKPREGLWSKQQADSMPERMSYVTITEGYRIIQSRAVSRGDSWKKINDQLNHWKDGEQDLGAIWTWSQDTVLVIDGLSRLAEAAMNFQLALNGRSMTGPQVGTQGGNDYSAAYRLIRDFLDMLKSSEIKCNIILICHISFQEQGEGASRERQGFPQTIGPMLSPQIGQYFNHAIEARRRGTQRVILTNTSDQVQLKNVAPLRVKPFYPLETGLAEYFRDIGADAERGISAPTAGPVVEAAK